MSRTDPGGRRTVITLLNNANQAYRGPADGHYKNNNVTFLRSYDRAS